MTPPDWANYIDDLLSTSLECPRVACYGRPSHRLITASDGGLYTTGALMGPERPTAEYETRIPGRLTSPHLWMGLWKLLNDV